MCEVSACGNQASLTLPGREGKEICAELGVCEGSAWREQIFSWDALRLQRGFLIPQTPARG